MMLETLSILKQEYDSEIARILADVESHCCNVSCTGYSTEDIVNRVIDSPWMRNPAAVLACTDATIGFVWPGPVGEPVTVDRLARTAMIDDAIDALERGTA